MLQLPVLREQKEEVIARLAIKNIDARATVEQILSLDSEKRKNQTVNLEK